MSRTSTPETAFIEMQRLVRQSADEVVAALPGEVDFVAREALGHVACAIVDTEGFKAGHEYASEAISRLDLPARDSFGVWADLFKQGDAEALPKARLAAGLASQDVPFVEAIGAMQLGGLHHAEDLVELVEAGDSETIPIARDTTKNVFVTERSALFGKLYRAGDAASFDLAVEAAQAAKRYTEETGDQHYYRSEQALVDMAKHAIKNENLDDALKLMNALEEESNKASLHAELFKHGRQESLQPVLDHLSFLPEYSKHSAHSLQRRLAEAGYAPALEAIRERTAPNPEKRWFRFVHRNPVVKYGELTDRIQDLIMLHNIGDASAAGRVLELVRNAEEPQYYGYHLGQVGLNDEYIKLAAELYAADPSPQNEEKMLFAEHDNDRWRRVFNYWLNEQGDVGQASSLVRNLAAHAKALREEKA